MSLALTGYSNCNTGFVMHCITVLKSFHFNALLSCCRTFITVSVKHQKRLKYYLILIILLIINTFFVLLKLIMNYVHTIFNIHK